MAFITNQTQLSLKAGDVITRRDNIVATATLDVALGDIVSFTNGQIVAATATSKNQHVAYRNNSFKETYNTGDSVNIMKDGEVYLTQESGQDLKVGDLVMVGTTNSTVVVHTGTNTVLGTVQSAPTTNGLVRIKLGA